jgi:biotin-(acetyl-CoA carboxylase) ligase
VNELPENGISLKVASGREWAVIDVERAVLARLSVHYERYLDDSGRPSLAGWLERALYLGDQVDIVQDVAVQRGRFTGVTANGSLVLMTETGSRIISSGDLTRGPCPVGPH